MACIARHEYKSARIGGGASKAAKVADRMARCVEEVKRAIAKVVVRVETAELQTPRCLGGEGDFVHLTALKIRVADARLRVRRIARGVGFLEPRTDDEAGGGREGGRVTDVVPVLVAPNNGFDISEGEVLSREDVSDVLTDGDGPAGGLYAVDDAGSHVRPVFANAEVEENFAVGRAVGDEERVGGTGEVGFAWEVGFEEGTDGHFDPCCTT